MEESREGMQRAKSEGNAECSSQMRESSGKCEEAAADVKAAQERMSRLGRWHDREGGGSGRERLSLVFFPSARPPSLFVLDPSSSYHVLHHVSFLSSLGRVACHAEDDVTKRASHRPAGQR
mmetsp:Transcript_41522/g.84892  ORF Transcript_41522/g.84892 Transcript_41522/m.84892 type:complete len:121 (+) Transcript_41522:135-497(+)